MSHKFTNQENKKLLIPKDAVNFSFMVTILPNVYPEYIS